MIFWRRRPDQPWADFVEARRMTDTVLPERICSVGAAITSSVCDKGPCTGTIPAAGVPILHHRFRHDSARTTSTTDRPSRITTAVDGTPQSSPALSGSRRTKRDLGAQLRPHPIIQVTKPDTRQYRPLGAIGDWHHLLHLALISVPRHRIELNLRRLPGRTR